ncbi:hypothetical protein AHAS_Ahas09G0156800 [Arachis hypogaea]
MKSLQMAESSQKDRKKVDVSVQHECLLNLLPREIWLRISTMVALNLIEDMFNMQATCKVFVRAASSNAEMWMSILRQGFMEYFWLGRRDKGMELLARVSMEGSVEAGYLCATLLLCDHEDEEEVQRGVQIMEVIRISGQLESCSKFFRDIFNDIMVFFEMFASE